MPSGRRRLKHTHMSISKGQSFCESLIHKQHKKINLNGEFDPFDMGHMKFNTVTLSQQVLSSKIILKQYMSLWGPLTHLSASLTSIL